MDYRGTDGNDNIDQGALGLSNGTNIYGGAGNDTITITGAHAIGEAGNDTIIGSNSYGGAVYWTSPAGIRVNLATGIAQDGFGTTDTLRNIRVLMDSGHGDHITGSTANEEFWLSWGNDTVIGGGGSDTVILYDVKSTEVNITYDLSTDTFTMVKNTAAGDKGTNTFTGISRISFAGPKSDNVNVTRDMFDFSDGFLRTAYTLPSFDMGKIAQMRAGDFNGDGKTDLLVVRINPDLGLTAEPLQILVGDGTGKFSDQTASFFKDGIPKVNYVPRIFAADFNKDGITDIFNPDFGYDAPPFPGGQNSLFLSNPGTRLLENASASLPQGLKQSHGTSVGDINNDGFPDLLVNVLHDHNGLANMMLVNDRTGHFVLSQSLLPASLRMAGYDPGYTWSMLRDVNNDGYADMVLGTWDANSGPSLVVLNDGHGSFAGSTPIALPRSGVSGDVVIGIETIDLNGDALPDLALSVTNGGSHAEFYKVPYIQLLVNDGNGRFHDETDARLPQTKTPDPTHGSNWYLSATPIDLNGDGFQDIVTHGNNAYGGSKVFMNDGTGKFVEGWQGGTFTNLLVTDVNGDGRPDLVESSTAGFNVLMNAFPNRVPASGVYRAGDGGERITGGAAKETIYGGKGNDTIDAGAGLDTVVYSGNRAQFTIARASGGFTVSGPEGSDTLAQVERVKFGDVSIALDIDGVAGQAYRVYEAAFNRTADSAGLGYWINTMDKGATLAQIAVGFVKSAEFEAKFGGKSNAEIVNEFYSNILNRAGEPSGTAWWIEQLNAGNATLAEVLVGFSEATENKANLVGVMQSGITFTPWG